MENYIFDNSFEGFLTLIFDYYVRKPTKIRVYAERDYQPMMFDETYDVITDFEKAERVHKSLKNKLEKLNYRAVQSVFLSEQKEAYQLLFEYCCYIINNDKKVQANFGNDAVLYVMQTARSVHREKHHHEAFIRFEQLNQNTFFAKIEPKFNILPLIVNHFEKRYADQNFIIYDTIRKYGIFYNKEIHQTQEIKLDFTPKTTMAVNEYIDVNEKVYQELWKSYFNSTNIVERKNTRLHVQSLPRRFWKNLTEK